MSETKSKYLGCSFLIISVAFIMLMSTFVLISIFGTLLFQKNSQFIYRSSIKLFECKSTFHKTLITLEASNFKSIFVQWIDEANSASFLVSQWNSTLLKAHLIFASDNCDALRILHNEYVPYIVAKSLRSALKDVHSSTFVQNNGNLGIIGWSAAPMLFQGNFAATIRALEQLQYDREWIAVGRVVVDDSINTSIFYPLNNTRTIIEPFMEGYPLSETIFHYAFKAYFPDWFLPMAFAPLKHFEMVVDEMLRCDDAMTLNASNIRQVIDITGTVEIRLKSPLTSLLSNRIQRESFDSMNVRATLRQFSSLSTLLSFNESEKVIITASKWPLEHVLREVAPNRTIIVSSSNCGYLDFVQNWLLSLKLIPDADAYSNSFMLIAEDMTTFHFLERVIPGRVVLPPFTVPHESAASNYADNNFLKLVSSRPLFLIKLFESGYTFLWSDVDIVFNRNLMSYLVDSPHDYVGQIDGNINASGYIYGPLNVCTCILFMRPGTEMIKKLLYDWLEAMKDSTTDDQRPFNKVISLMHESLNMTWLKPYHQFPPGMFYFDNQNWYRENNQSEPVFIHNNFIVGHDNKRDRFININKWFVKNHRYALDVCVKNTNA